MKQYTRFGLDFNSKWTNTCSGLMGLAFFLRVVYYFALRSFRDVNFFEILITMILGIALCAAFVVYITCLRRNAPGLYGMLGAAHCMTIFVLCCTTGNWVRIILAVIWYASAATVLLATVAGYLPGRLLAALMFAVPAVVRLLFFDLGHIGLIGWVLELSVLAVLVGLSCLAMGLRPIVKR